MALMAIILEHIYLILKASKFGLYYTYHCTRKNHLLL